MKTPEEIVDDSGILLTKNAIEAGISKHALYNFIRDNGFEKAAHGVYASPETWEDENYILSLRCLTMRLSIIMALLTENLCRKQLRFIPVMELPEWLRTE